MPRYLVTGAAGFLGYHLAARLSDEPDSDVVCVDNFIRGERDAAYRALCDRRNVTGIEIDLNDRASVFGLDGEFDIIFHLAALNGTQNFYEHPMRVLECCTLPTFWLLERFGASKAVRRFVYAGTSESYAATVTRFGWAVPTAEDVPLCIDDVTNPRWSYAASKIHGEVLVAQASRHYGMPFTILRYHNAYGPRMGDRHVIPDFLMRARAGKFALYGYQETRSFLYSDDTVAATIAVATAPQAAGEIVNIGSEEEVTMLHLAETIMQVCGFSGSIDCHPAPAGSVARRAPDLGKLRAITGFRPKVSLQEGLRRTAAFYLGSEAG